MKKGVKEIKNIKNGKKFQKNDKKFTKTRKNSIFVSLTIMGCVYFLKTVKNKNMLSDTSFHVFVQKLDKTKSIFGHL